MSYRRIEFGESIPGPKTMEDPLGPTETAALKRLSPFILEALQTKNVQRIIDYTGNYFLVFPDVEKETK